MGPQLRAPHDLGFVPQPSSFSTISLALQSGYWLGYAFVPADSKTLTRVRIYNGSGMVGSPTGANTFCDIYSDSGGAPNASLTGGAGATLAANPAASSWIEWTGLSVAVTAGTMSWVVIKSLDASNYIAPVYGNGQTGIVQSMGASASWGWVKKHSTNSGGAWGNTVSDPVGWRIGYSDGSFNGMPVSAIFNDTFAVYGSNEVGVQFTAPAGAGCNVRGIVFNATFTGAAAGRGALAYRLYDGNGNLLGTTSGIPAGNIASAAYVPAYFTSPVVLNPGATYRATMTQAGSGDSAHYYLAANAYTWDSDSNSLGLLPMDGTYQYVTFNGTSFSAGASTPVLPFSLLLDTTGEFNPTGGPRNGLLVYPPNIPLF
jgi:hypothetical protein